MTNRERERRSRARQALGVKRRVWEQRIKDMESPQALSAPGAAAKLDFCRQEHTKCLEAMRLINRGVGRQRAWVSG